MNRLIKLFLFASAFTFIFSAQALQLGKISINSKQEQPLNADIEVILTKADDVTELVPSIASKEDFESQGIERLPVHANIDANFVKNSEGKVYLKLKSEKPVKDPFLDLLIQIDSPKGRNYREYTVLLDPPDPMDKMINETLEKDSSKKDSNKLPAKDLAEGKKREIDSDKNVEEKIDLTEDQKEEVVEEKQDTAKKVNVKESVVNSKEEDLNDQEIDELKTVKSVPGKTLYQIGRENSLSGITLEQMVVGIYQNNRKAFAEGNINGLNKNKVLTIPNKSYFSDLSHLEARKILKSQNDEWKKLTQPKAKENKSTKKVENNIEKEKIENLEQKLAEAEQKLKKLSQAQVDSIEPEQQKTIDKETMDEISKQNEVIDIEGSDFEIEEIVLDDVKESDEDVFTSSISADSDINETVLIEDEANQNDNLMIVLVLLFLVVVVAGAIFFISSKRRAERTIFSSGINDNSQNNQSDIIDNLSREDKNSF
ncbi:conserved hypothetical protein [beta proteobacterium KB13]|uniref:FimV N-terminal domain-containing protein n=1 Tax=beta proteobacterium KB13 TaxID=314607 RepID=B6BUA0_9PROT|nr:conserved hypothetical protein [beta proteobacterium KB13]